MPQTATKSINLAAGSQPIHPEEIEIDAMVIVIGLSVFMSNGIGRTCRDADGMICMVAATFISRRTDIALKSFYFKFLLW